MARTLATGPAPGSSETGTTDRTQPCKPLGSAQLQPAAIFSHHMVLQRDAPIAVFGTGEPSLQVRVCLSDNTHGLAVATCTVNSDGSWLATLPAQPAGGPYILHVSGENVFLHYEDVMIGEVWIAAGQSNMEFELRNADGAETAIEHSASLPIRFYNVPKRGRVDSELLADEQLTTWHNCNENTSGSMSAVAFFFAERMLESEPNVTIGIVDCYVGDTSVSCWMSRKTLRSTKEGERYWQRYLSAIEGLSESEQRACMNAWQNDFDAWNAAAGTPDRGERPWPPPLTNFSQFRPTGPFEAMVERIAPFGARGVLWYQGEEDTPHANDYAVLLHCMIDQWRAAWGANLPFIIAQLPQFMETLGWVEIRAAQAQVAREIDNAFLACLMDCGEEDDVHPTDKRTPGRRLAHTVLTRSSVKLLSARLLDSNQVLLAFNEELAPDVDSAVFDIEVSKVLVHGNEVLLSCANEPESLRYGWYCWGAKPIMSRSGVPAEPFIVSSFER